MYNQNQNQSQTDNKTIRESVFSKMLRAGSKNYFFDVKKASNGSNYLTITDSFKDHTANFIATLEEAKTYLQ